MIVCTCWQEKVKTVKINWIIISSMFSKYWFVFFEFLNTAINTVLPTLYPGIIVLSVFDTSTSLLRSVGQAYPASQGKFSCKDFSTQYSSTSSFSPLDSCFLLLLILHSKVSLQAWAHFPNQRALKVKSYNSTFVLETEGDSIWITFMAPGVYEPLSLQLP